MVDILTTEILIAVPIALVAVVVFTHLLARANVAVAAEAQAEPKDPVPERRFLVVGGDVVDTSEAAQAYLRRRGFTEISLVLLLSFLRSRFGDIGKDLSQIPEGQQRRFPVINNANSDEHVMAVRAGETLRISWRNAVTDDREATLLDALEDEVQSLRPAIHNAPILIWRENAKGEIVWANGTYFDVAREIFPDSSSADWPPRPIFRLDRNESLMGAGALQRLSIGEGQNLRWFEITTNPIENGGQIVFAIDAGKTVRAENAQQNFVQVLTKTFAHLSTGLAIFNKSRHLTLFNPAMGDLFGLPFEFLSGRPTLYGFLDRLRDSKMLPEPKDYKSWRQQIIELESAAETGNYCEAWHLPGGKIIRVSGRPHPDGAVAFLFEDISAEVSLTQQFKAEIDLTQSIFDLVDHAIIVVADTGSIVRTNSSYHRLFPQEPEKRAVSITQATQKWQEVCHPTPIWGELRDFVITPAERADWDGVIQMKNGQAVRCRVSPMARGHTAVVFEPIYPSEAEAKVTIAPDPHIASG